VIGDHERDVGVFSVHGRKLENPNAPTGLLGTIGTLRRASGETLKAARRHLREIPGRTFESFERVGPRQWRDPDSGAEWELVRGFVDLTDPASSRATAFVIRDGLLVPLKPAGTRPEEKTTVIGDMVAS
jgi:hypothetical protein